ncbi:MAG: hypothetical protein IKK94_06625 [Clostridia bacterium]|nr:hypothetical protein [Clostridia bacterium]
MKKILVVLLALVLALAMVACGDNGDAKDTETNAGTDTTLDTTVDTAADTEGGDVATVMSYADYMAAELDAPVVIEAYVQAKQSWWDNKATIYTQDQDGAYFIYEMVCSEEDYAKLVPGTKIRVNGFKTAWEGEVEIASGATFEIIEGADTYVAEPVDLTEVLGTEELINYQNQLASFKGMTVEAVEFKNGEPGDDIYVTLGLGGASYSFCVEFYLTGTDTEVYRTVSALEVGNVVDVEGFVYWYQGVNPHITAVTVVG